MVINSNVHADLLERLAAQPALIERMTSVLTPDQLRTPASPDAWSGVGILAHLRACADVWGDYIGRIVEEDGVTIRATNPRRWIRQTNYVDLEFGDSFAAFVQQRTHLLSLLGGLSAAEWSHAATITDGGAPRRRTVFDYARWLADHERSHLRQFKQLVTSFSEQH